METQATVPPAPERKPSAELSYYSKLPVSKTLLPKLFNLDEEESFKSCKNHLVSDESSNFVADFDDDRAWCAFNLETDELTALLDKNRPRPFEARWIHIWAPERQVEFVKALTGHYGMSHRLAAMMYSDPAKSRKITPLSPPLARSSHDGHGGEGFGSSESIKSGDIEAGGADEALESLEKRREFDMSNITFSQLVDTIWHFSSLDYGSNWYNALYVVPGLTFNHVPGRPDGKRVWSWLIICNDGTVISIQENPLARESFSAEQKQTLLKAVRRHTGIILKCISNVHKQRKDSNPMMRIHLRNASNIATDARVGKGDRPSLLFYYIFDDWATNYGLVIGREHSYGVALEKLRRSMLEKPQVDLVTELHRIGRELAVLKRLYQSYELTATRILHRQRQMMGLSRSNGVRTPGQIRGVSKANADFMRNGTWATNIDDEDGDIGEPDMEFKGGVQLRPAALNRVERLVDRIRLYALSEIEECLNEKETLTFLVFNLIAIRDSTAVEKLTRSTVLLSKFTILFLPISLLTSYFSTEVDELKGTYTARNYWTSFGVIVFLSITGLALFGWINNFIGGRSTHRTIKKHFMEARKALHQKRT